MESTVLINDPATARRHLHYNGINHVTVGDNAAEVFKAYLNFALHHTINDAEVYDNAAANSRLSEQKKLFVQLACRKKEVIDKLKMHRSDSTFIYVAGWKQTGYSLAEHQKEVESVPPATMNGTLNFAYQREHRTLALYEKLGKTAHLSSVRVLFDYLLESQRHQILYLTTQCAAISCTLL